MSNKYLIGGLFLAVGVIAVLLLRKKQDAASSRSGLIQAATLKPLPTTTIPGTVPQTTAQPAPVVPRPKPQLDTRVVSAPSAQPDASAAASLPRPK